jgi:hypothetical protein
MLTRCVRQRFALGQLWRQRPELLTTQLVPPIIVIGQMRGGTTRIHRLLAADPAHSATRFCDSWNPVPERPDLRPIKGAAALRMARVLNPWLDVLHPMTATGVEEELGWLAVGLSGSAFYTQWHIPTFTRWGEQADPCRCIPNLPASSEPMLRNTARRTGRACSRSPSSPKHCPLCCAPGLMRA